MPHISAKHEYIKSWRAHVDDIIQNVFPNVDDKTLFRFFRLFIDRFASLLYDHLVETGADFDKVVESIKSIGGLTFMDKELPELLDDFARKNKGFPDELFTDHLALFMMALGDRFMRLSKSSWKNKLDMYRAEHILLKKKYLLLPQDQRPDTLYEQMIAYLEIQIAECERLVAQETASQEKPFELVFFVRQPGFSDKALTKLAEHLSLRGIIRDKQLFISFLCSNDVMVPIHLPKILYYIEVIRYLYKGRKLIKLNKGKQYLWHTMTHIEDFPIGPGKSTVSQILARLRRKHPPNHDIIAELKLAIGQIVS